MAILLYLRTGHCYRLADNVTLDAVNATLAANVGRFFQVPLHSGGALLSGSPELGADVAGLFVTPESVSHFVVV